MLRLDNQNENFPEILILEDDSIIALIQKYLVEKVFEIKPLLFKNGKEALDYLEGRTTKRDILIFLDINMPVMDGWEFISAFNMRAFNFRAHIVMVTSSLFKEDCEKAKEFEEVVGYYTKPLKEEDLREIIDIKDLSSLQIPVKKKI